MNTANQGLWMAIKEGSLLGVRAWIDQGADVSHRNDVQETPLHAAARSGKVEICGQLIAKGSDVNALDLNGWTPLHRAAKSGHADVCRMLLRHGAVVTLKSVSGLTPLHCGATSHSPAVCRLLIEHQAEVEALCDMLRTPLRYAVESRSLTVCKTLIDAGARSSLIPDGHDQCYLTPFQVAVRTGLENIATYFLDEAGEDLRQTSVGGNDLLAIANGREEMLTLLHSRITDASVRDALDLSGQIDTPRPAGGLAPL